MARRTYGQFCALARTFDVIGDRWTPLVIRELVAGPKRYTDVIDALPGVGTSLLIERLRSLQADGIVRRRRLPAPAAADVYELTTLGRELAAALLPLVLWGARHLLDARREDDVFRAEWPLLMLAAVPDPARTAGVHAVIQFDIDGSLAHLRVDDGRITVHRGTPPEPADARIAMPLEAFVEVGAGRLSPPDAVARGQVEADGDADALRLLFDLIGQVVAMTSVD